MGSGAGRRGADRARPGRASRIVVGVQCPKLHARPTRKVETLDRDLRDCSGENLQVVLSYFVLVDCVTSRSPPQVSAGDALAVDG